ncbi:hypothetical protein VNI00_014724 [Paramarasmius palmivorus]|uniref:Uncharacterized protein n=1 Tax=Paramarasmius palmivorus TaxID=297713 RepID=A0AAW0BS49_9AGAR
MPDHGLQRTSFGHKLPDLRLCTVAQLQRPTVTPLLCPESRTSTKSFMLQHGSSWSSSSISFASSFSQATTYTRYALQEEDTVITLFGIEDGRKECVERSFGGATTGLASLKTPSSGLIKLLSTSLVAIIEPILWAVGVRAQAALPSGSSGSLAQSMDGLAIYDNYCCNFVCSVIFNGSWDNETNLSTVVCASYRPSRP